MVEALFILGPSGSGKSTLSRYSVQFAKANGWEAYAMSDYPLLYEMFRSDTEEQFEPGDPRYGGFKVLRMGVYDTVLDELNKHARNLAERAEENTLITIEFARDNYREALKHFDPHLLRAAHFLFLDADIETCKRRIYERVNYPQDFDDHFVPEPVIERFGQESNKQSFEAWLKLDYEIASDRVEILDTRRPIQEVKNDVQQFVAGKLKVPVPIVS